GLSAVDIAKASRTTPAMVSARRRSNAKPTAIAVQMTKRTSPDLDQVIGITTAQQIAVPIDSQLGALRAENIKTAAHATRVRKRAVMFGSANVMFKRLTTAGLGDQMCRCPTWSTNPSTATPAPETRKAIHARLWSRSESGRLATSSPTIGYSATPSSWFSECGARVTIQLASDAS